MCAVSVSINVYGEIYAKELLILVSKSSTV